MRLMFASHSAGMAGAEQSLLHLVEEAAKRGHTGKVILPKMGPLAERLLDLSPSFEVVTLKSHLWMGRRYSIFVGSIRFLQAIADLPRYLSHIRSENYDAVVVNSSVAPVPLLSAYLRRVPVLLVIRESLVTNPMLKSVIPKSFIRRLLFKWATEIVCISDYVAKQFGFPSKITYPQVGQEFFNLRVISSESGSGQRRAIMCGTISPEKGQLDAVRAISVARANGTDVHLDIYGQGTARDTSDLLSAISKLDVSDLVSVKGPTTDVLAAYDSSDVAIVCSRNEGFGKVTAEAILTGHPVVAYGLGGTSEILARGGGICTEPSPHALGKALCKVFADDRLMSRLKREAAASTLREELSSSARQVIDTVEALRKSEG